MSNSTTVLTGADSLASNVEIVTPDTAQKILAENPYDRQRNLRNWQVHRLAREMRRGTFKPTSILLAQVKGNGKQHLLDGQHRLNAIVEYGKPVTLFVNRITVENEEELREWYANYDQNLTRPLLEGLRVMNLAEETGLTEQQLKFTSSCMRIIADGFSQGTISSSNRGELFRSVTIRAKMIRDWAPYARQYFEAMTDTPRSLKIPMLRQSTMGVALVTYRYVPDHAELFWTAVGQNDGLKKGEPAHTLVGFLLSDRDTKGLANIHARQVATCWNAYMDNRELSRISLKEWSRPILIKGTPYNGKDVVIYDEIEEEEAPTGKNGKLP